MILILISILLACFLTTVCIHHFVDGIRREQKKNVLKKRTRLIVRHTSTKISEIVANDRIEVKKDKLAKLIEYVYKKMFNTLNQYMSKLLGKDKSLNINPQQNLKFNVIRKGNAPNEKFN